MAVKEHYLRRRTGTGVPGLGIDSDARARRIVDGSVAYTTYTPLSTYNTINTRNLRVNEEKVKVDSFYYDHVTTNEWLSLTSPIIQGDKATERVGNNILVHRIQFQVLMQVGGITRCVMLSPRGSEAPALFLPFSPMEETLGFDIYYDIMSASAQGASAPAYIADLKFNPPLKVVYADRLETEAIKNPILMGFHGGNMAGTGVGTENRWTAAGWSKIYFTDA